MHSGTSPNPAPDSYRGHYQSDQDDDRTGDGPEGTATHHAAVDDPGALQGEQQTQECQHPTDENPQRFPHVAFSFYTLTGYTHLRLGGEGLHRACRPGARRCVVRSIVGHERISSAARSAIA